MTFDAIVARTMERLNLTSTEAQTRIGVEVNEVYREFVSSMGMDTSIRSTVSTLSTNASRYITFGDGTATKVIKLLSVYLPNNLYPPPYNVLTSATFDEMRNTIAGTWPPTRYAISRMGANTVEIFTDATAPDSLQVVNADCLLASATMSGTDQPFFPENFHDILIYGVMAIELDKMEKEERAAKAQARFEQRASELRMFIAKDAYLMIHQAKTLQGWIGTQLIPS